MSITGPAMCKICGHQHYRYQPHVFADQPTERKRAVARKPDPSIPAVVEQPAARDTDAAPLLHNVTQPFSLAPNLEALPNDLLIGLRRRVMAEYMRRKRAKTL